MRSSSATCSCSALSCFSRASVSGEARPPGGGREQSVGWHGSVGAGGQARWNMSQHGCYASPWSQKCTAGNALGKREEQSLLRVCCPPEPGSTASTEPSCCMRLGATSRGPAASAAQRGRARARQQKVQHLLRRRWHFEQLKRGGQAQHCVNGRPLLAHLRASGLPAGWR